MARSRSRPTSPSSALAVGPLLALSVTRQVCPLTEATNPRAAETWVKWTEPPAGTPLLEDLADPASPNAEQRYAFSKLVSIFLARQLSQLSQAKGVVVDVVCPGLCLSELVRHCDDGMRRDLQARSLPTAPKRCSR